MSTSDPPTAWFSPGALQQLRVAVDHRLAAPAGGPHEALNDACRRLRAEAQVMNLGATDLVKAVREASLATVHARSWVDTPDLRYYRMLADCLTTFFEETSDWPER